jgi:hypothetical protein
MACQTPLSYQQFKLVKIVSMASDDKLYNMQVGNFDIPGAEEVEMKHSKTKAVFYKHPLFILLAIVLAVFLILALIGWLAGSRETDEERAFKMMTEFSTPLSEEDVVRAEKIMVEFNTPLDAEDYDRALAMMNETQAQEQVARSQNGSIFSRIRLTIFSK